MIGASGFLTEELRRDMRRITNRDQQIKKYLATIGAYAGEIVDLRDEKEATHKYIHELLASIESGEPYGGYAPETVTCKFCGVEEE